MLETIMNRRSIRKYLDQPVEEEKIRLLLKAASYAPSAQNCQPWHFLLCDDRAKLDAFRAIHPYSAMLQQAPLMILVCGDKARQAGEWFYLEDCAAATQNILLAAEEMGLGTCWLGLPPCSQRQADIKKLFELPDSIEPFCGIAVGYPQQKADRPQRDLEGKIHYNVW